MCNLTWPGTLRTEVDDQEIASALSPEVQYACRYWVHPLEQSGGRIRDGDLVDAFLKKYFLYWLEAMSLMGEASESIYMVNSLQSLIDVNGSTAIFDFLRDGKHFVLRNRSILEDAPPQLYSSALIFAPETSTIRKTFEDHIPIWLTRLPKVQKDWNALMQTLEGHSNFVQAVAFSPHGQLVASASYDNTLRPWDADTGSCRSTLEGHSSFVKAVAISPDGQLVASASDDSTIRLWDTGTGSCRSTLTPRSTIRTLSFSPDGSHLDTNRGNIFIPLSLPIAPFHQNKKLCAILIEDHWVASNGQRFLWLPPDYRPTCIAVYASIICLGHASGNVSLIEFNF